MKTFDPECGFLYITGPKEDIQALSNQFFSENDPLEFLTVQEGAFSTLTCSKYAVAWDFDIVKAAEMFPNCEIIKYRGRLFQGVSECFFKLLNSTTLQKEYFNIKCILDGAHLMGIRSQVGLICLFSVMCHILLLILC